MPPTQYVCAHVFLNNVSINKVDVVYRALFKNIYIYIYIYTRTTAGCVDQSITQRDWLNAKTVTIESTLAYDRLKN